MCLVGFVFYLAVYLPPGLMLRPGGGGVLGHSGVVLFSFGQADQCLQQFFTEIPSSRVYIASVYLYWGQGSP